MARPAAATPTDASTSPTRWSMTARRLRSCDPRSRTTSTARMLSTAAAIATMATTPPSTDGRVVEPANTLDDEPPGHRDDEHRIGQRGQDRRPVIAVRTRCRGRTPRPAHRDQCEQDRRDVDQVVTGVGHQTQRVGLDTGDELTGDDQQVEAQGDDQRPATAGARRRARALLPMRCWLSLRRCWTRPRRRRCRNAP